MLYLVVLISILGCFHCVNGECTVVSQSETRYLKRLDPLKGEKVKVHDTSKNYTYDIRFCEVVPKTDRAGVAQYDLHTTNHTHIIGRITATNIMAGTDWMLLQYEDGDTYHSHCGSEARRATIFITCDRNNLVSHPTLIEENSEKQSGCSYIFELGSYVACSNSTSKPSSSSGLSIGSIIVISALAIAAAYLIFGVLYKRCALGAKGREQIPNIDFWVNFGSLTADGCDFVCRCNKKEESKSYKGLGDDQLGFEEEEERDDNILPMY